MYLKKWMKKKSLSRDVVEDTIAYKATTRDKALANDLAEVTSIVKAVKEDNPTDKDATEGMNKVAA